MSECRGVGWRFIRRKGLTRDPSNIFAKHEHSANNAINRSELRRYGREERYKR